MQGGGNWTDSSTAAKSASTNAGNGRDASVEVEDDEDESNSMDVSPLISLLWLTGSGGGFMKNPIALMLLLSRIIASRGKGVRNKNPAYIPPIEQHYTFERLNERHSKDGMALQKAMGQSLTKTKTTSSKADAEAMPWGPSKLLRPGAFLQQHAQSSLSSTKPKTPEYTNGTVIVMDLTSAHVTQTTILRDQVTFLLNEHRKQQAIGMKDSPPARDSASLISMATNHTALNTTTNATSTSSEAPEEDTTVHPEIEVVILLESPGGSATDYALASQQIMRLRREPGITVTIAVDKVAASGGYMIACCSSPGQLLAAPFSMLGSIGVIG